MSWSKKCYYAAAILFIFGCTSCYHVVSSSSSSSLCYSEESSMCIKHEKWMAEHGFSYENEKVKKTRYQIFKDNVAHIERHNQEGKHTYKLGINEFADLTNEEFLAKYARSSVPSFNVTSNQSSFEYKCTKHVPHRLDWRDYNAVTPIQNQGDCGSCWAFSAVAAIESIVAIRSGKLTRLSQQHVLDCNYEHDTCEGGLIHNAFEFVIKNGGLASAIDYPYTAIQGKCSNNKPSSLSLNITGYSVVPQNNEKALLKAVANQPIAVYIDASTFQFYKSGVMTGKCGTRLNHGVVIVGYGKEDGVKFWLLKNSWGRGWGENGYMKLKRKVHAKEGMCGIAMFPVYPNV